MGTSQLLIVDGGVGQLNVAMEVLDELDVSGVDGSGWSSCTHRKTRRYGYV